MGFLKWLALNTVGIGSWKSRKKCTCGKNQWCKEHLDISSEGSVKKKGMWSCHKNRQAMNKYGKIFKDNE